MKRTVAGLGAALLLALLGGASLLLLPGPPPAPVDPSPPSPPAPRPAPPAPAEVPPADIAEEPPEPPPPPSDDELPPGDYPWRVPPWWRATEARLAAAPLRMGPDQLPFRDLLARIAEASGVEVSLGPELAAWGEDRVYAVAHVDGNALSFLDLLASVHNLEPVLGRNSVVLHQRGRAKETPVVRSGRVQWTLRVARERRDGLRDPDPAEEGMLATAVPWDVDGGLTPGRTYTARALAAALGRSLAVPVYLDGALWEENGSAEVGVAHSLGDLLGAVAPPLRARFEATPRRVVLFR